MKARIFLTVSFLLLFIPVNHNSEASGTGSLPDDLGSAGINQFGEY